jgi:DNA polymerase I
MEIQILDVDYVMVENRVVLRLFGKTEKSEPICVFYEGFQPYFFVDKDPSTVLNGALIEKVKRTPLGTKIDWVWKVTISNPAEIPILRQKLEGAGFTTYEADILFKYRFMADYGLSGFGWVKIENGKNVSTSSIRVPAIEAKKIEPIERMDDVKLKILAFDIECVADKDRAPDPKRDQIILISLAFSEPFEGKNSLVMSIRADDSVKAFDDESELIKNFFEIVNKYDPDIITGYNCNNFDFPYIVERATKLGIKALIGRCTQKPVIVRKIGNKYRISIPGRIVVDSYEIIKRDFFLHRYGLDFVAEKLLGEKKIDIRYSQIAQFWKSDQSNFKKLVDYSEKDAILALELLKRLNLIDKYITLSKVAGILLQDAIDGGETTRIEHYILREFNNAGYILPCKPSSEQVKERESKNLIGGEVLEPEKGLHSNVAVLDFKAMYPSIICAFNICPSTLTDEKENVIVTPSGARFLPKERKEGVIPRIESRLMKERQAIKRRLKKINDEKLARTLWLHQWALKIMANAFYGYFGYSRSRLFNLDIANAITSSGRSIILHTKEFIENQLGYKVLYGDTDSLFIKLHSDNFEQQIEEAKKITEQIAKQLPYGMEIEFEKIFKRFLPLTKKRYTALALLPTENGFEEKIETKGIETVRRDWCNLVGITMNGVLEILLKENDVKKAVQYFKKIVEQLLANQIPIQNLVITKTITKAPRSYLGIQPHIEVAKKIQLRSPGESPGIGDRIGYVIVKGSPNEMLSKRAEDPNYVIERGLHIDSNYYILNQLLPPIERIFKSLGISKTELLGNGRQIALFDMLNKGPFTCSQCGRNWLRPPLSGICECGYSF